MVMWGRLINFLRNQGSRSETQNLSDPAAPFEREALFQFPVPMLLTPLVTLPADRLVTSQACYTLFIRARPLPACADRLSIADSITRSGNGDRSPRARLVEVLVPRSGARTRNRLLILRVSVTYFVTCYQVKPSPITAASEGPGFGKSFLCSFRCSHRNPTLETRGHGFGTRSHHLSPFIKRADVQKPAPLFPLPAKETLPLGFGTNRPIIDRF
jgi:hypothetical protein